jgi:hypothetical protein
VLDGVPVKLPPCVDNGDWASISGVYRRQSKQKFRRRGFVLGVFGGMLFIAYKVLKYPGSIDRRDAFLSLALVLSIGLAGGLIGMALGRIHGSSDVDN